MCAYIYLCQNKSSRPLRFLADLIITHAPLDMLGDDRALVNQALRSWPQAASIVPSFLGCRIRSVGSWQSPNCNRPTVCPVGSGSCGLDGNLSASRSKARLSACIQECRSRPIKPRSCLCPRLYVPRPPSVSSLKRDEN